MNIRYAIAASLLAVSACSDQSEPIETTVDIAKQVSEANKKVNPKLWPKNTYPVARDEKMEANIKALVARMTIEEKVGQVIQGDIASTTPEDVKKYNLGSVLNGGNSAPGDSNRAPAMEWVKLADEFWQASTDTSDGGVGIPLIWGTDAVHGHNNIVGATLFPHNIGLGAANDPELMRRIGQVTAKEIRVTGQDWTFAPTLAVARNDRWGRTYESYSEDPTRVASYASPLIEGLQGKADSEQFLADQYLIATAKHFVGDGGTHNGKDQGDTLVTEQEMIDIHAAGYSPAIQSGIQVIMASFNAWNGQKMHGYKAMLDDVLVDQMGFDGFVVGDWNGHGQVAGCSNVSCPAAINAGLDMYMASDSWQDLYYNLVKQVKSGEVTETRLNQAVSRILRVKMRAGIMQAGLPSTRPYTGKLDLLSTPEHKAVGREAVRKSLVLLKNNDNLLPLAAKVNVLVAGDGADDIGKQSGGWTINWQGTGLTKADFPNGQSIYDGIAEAVSAAGGQVTLNPTGDFEDKPDVAIVVFGEDPYAEFQGDRANLDFESKDGLNTLKKLQSQGIKTVSVFLTGRPLWVNPELNVSDAFVVAWLPGSEGAGVADVIFGDGFDFTGRLSFSWPNNPHGAELNIGDDNYDPLFALGYGLSKSDQTNMRPLSEDTQGVIASHRNNFMFAGDPVQPWRLVITDEGGNTQVTNNLQVSSKGLLQAAAKDFKAQEDITEFTWSGPAKLTIRGVEEDLSEALSANKALSFTYNLVSEQVDSILLRVGCQNECSAFFDITKRLNELGKGWQTFNVNLQCFADKGADFSALTVPFEIQSGEGTILQLGEAKLISSVSNECP